MTIFDAVQTLGMRWPKGGKLACPAHADKTPSLQLYGNTNSWYCFSCGKTGDAIGLLALFTGKSFKSLLAEYGDNSPQRAHHETLELVGPQAMIKLVERKFFETSQRVWPRLHAVFGPFDTQVLVDEIERMGASWDELRAWATNRFGEDDVLYGVKDDPGEPPAVRDVLKALASWEAEQVRYLEKRDMKLRHPGRSQEKEGDNA